MGAVCNLFRDYVSFRYLKLTNVRSGAAVQRYQSFLKKEMNYYRKLQKKVKIK